MKCVHPEKPCPYRKRVCKNGYCWDNCEWSCPYNYPMSECEVAQETWGCLFMCVYDALSQDSICPFKKELQAKLTHELYEMSRKQAKE